MWVRKVTQVFVRKMCSEEVTKPIKLPMKTRIFNYFKNIAEDYKLVAKETVEDMREKPLKTAVILSMLGASVYCCKTNPSEQSFYNQVLAHSNELLLIGEPIRNPYCDQYNQRIIEAYNAGCVKRLSFGFFSVIWLDNYSRDVDIFEARCKPLKVGWLELPERTIDIGFVGRWFFLDKSMENYDVNPLEWNENDERTFPRGIKEYLVK